MQQPFPDCRQKVHPEAKLTSRCRLLGLLAELRAEALHYNLFLSTFPTLFGPRWTKGSTAIL